MPLGDGLKHKPSMQLLEVTMRARMTWGCVKKHEVHVKEHSGTWILTKLASGEQALSKYYSLLLAKGVSVFSHMPGPLLQ